MTKLATFEILVSVFVSLLLVYRFARHGLNRPAHELLRQSTDLRYASISFMIACVVTFKLDWTLPTILLFVGAIVLGIGSTLSARCACEDYKSQLDRIRER